MRVWAHCVSTQFSKGNLQILHVSLTVIKFPDIHTIQSHSSVLWSSEHKLCAAMQTAPHVCPVTRRFLKALLSNLVRLQTCGWWLSKVWVHAFLSPMTVKSLHAAVLSPWTPISAAPRTSCAVLSCTPLGSPTAAPHIQPTLISHSLLFLLLRISMWCFSHHDMGLLQGANCRDAAFP